MQNLKIEGFLGIKEANVSLSGITVIIGPQASGKSIVARLFYFFNEYFADFDELALMKNEHKKTYDSRKKEEFSKLFPNYAWHEDSFEICYQNDYHVVYVRSARGSSSIEIATSKSVATNFRQLKKAYQDFSEAYPNEVRLSSLRMLREFREMVNQSNLVQFEHALFVPAARSFYATIREEIFAILSIDEKIDKIIMQFGDFYETAKSRLAYEQGRTRSRKANMPYRSYFDKIVKGRYARIDGRDWIDMPRGRIEMSKASSGQQEAFPLLVALAQFPAPGRSLIIEEPEAHLFPSSQAAIVEFIVRQSRTKNASIFITTHSPYLLSALNNYVLRGLKGMPNGIPPERIGAFSLQEGYSESIVDDETGLISAEYIDSVSDDIYEEFVNILSYDEEASSEEDGDDD